MRYIIGFKGGDLMDNKHQLVRTDKNFQHNPLFFGSRKAFQDKRGLWVFETKDGYKVECALVPKKFDYLILLQLMFRIQINSFDKTIKTSRHNILKTCNIHSTTKSYERLQSSLQTWLHTVCVFDNCWYKNKQ